MISTQLSGGKAPAILQAAPGFRWSQPHDLPVWALQGQDAEGARTDIVAHRPNYVKQPIVGNVHRSPANFPL